VAEGVLVMVVLHGGHMRMLHDCTVGVHGVSWRGGRGLALRVADAKMLSVPGIDVCLVMVCW
jgi:hypothetical protein